MNHLSEQKIAESELQELIRKKVKKRNDFYIHLFVYCIGMGLWLLKLYTEFEVNFLPFRYINWFVMGIWTIAIVIQTIDLLVCEWVFGKKWEEKKMRQLMQNSSKKETWE